MISTSTIRQLGSSATATDRVRELITSVCTQNELVELQETLYRSKNPTRRWLHCSRRDWILAAIRKAAQQSAGRALEVGPGSGVYLPALASLYREVVAIDKEEVYLNHARPLIDSYPNLHLVVDDITASRLADSSFDLILCTEVIEHIADSTGALAEMHRLLRPDGKLLLSTPQRYSPLELVAKIAFIPGIIEIVRFVYREPILETGHINLMTAKAVSYQLKRAGFEIEERFKSGMYLPLVAEFMGNWGLMLEQYLETKIRDRPLDGMLWTQYYVANIGTR